MIDLFTNTLNAEVPFLVERMDKSNEQALR